MIPRRTYPKWERIKNWWNLRRSGDSIAKMELNDRLAVWRVRCALRGRQYSKYRGGWYRKAIRAKERYDRRRDAR